MKFYNVVWADDEIDSLFENYNEIFNDLGIEIIKFRNSKEAIQYIEKNPKRIDGIITDAKYPKEGESVDINNNSFPGLSDFMINLKAIRINCKKEIPCLILTGFGTMLYDKFPNGELNDVFFDVLDKKAEYKVKKQKLENLCNEIEKINSPTFRIRKKYNKIFEACNEKYLGVEIEKKLYYLLTCIDMQKAGNFTDIRMVLEALFEKLSEKSFFPDNCKKMNERAYYLKNKKWIPLIPYHITKQISFIVNIVQYESHFETDITNSISKGSPPYLFQSVMYSLMDILFWVPSFLVNYNQRKVERIKNEINFIPKQIIINKKSM